MKRLIWIVGLVVLGTGVYAQGPLQNISMSPSSNFSYRDKRVVHNLIDNFNKYVYYPYGTYDISSYSTIGNSIIKAAFPRTGTYNITTGSGAYNVIQGTIDTIYVNGTKGAYFSNYDQKLFYNTTYRTNGSISGQGDYYALTDFKGAPTLNFIGFNKETAVRPNSGDTVNIGVVIGLYNTVPFAGNGKSKIGTGYNVNLYSVLDDNTAVDSLLMVRIYGRDTGIPDDSIQAFYAIYNEDGAVRPTSGRNYFAYSEYGDMYLGGGADMTVTGAYIQTQLTGSLTDGAPTDAEIDAIVGDTPANMGAGWTVTILDSNGTGLLYRVESDGTNWIYWAGTQAL